jgi:hypothetical protein
MAAPRRQTEWHPRHVQIAGTGAVIFEDDYDSEFRFSGPPLAALKSLDSIDRVVYAGTFSKLLFPAIRLAYLVLPERLIDPFVAALSLTTRHMPIWNQVILSDFIAEGHFSRHLRRMRLLYSERSQALQQAAAIHWSDFLVMPRIESGLDTAVLLRPRIDDRAAAAAARANIELRPCGGIRNDVLVSGALSLASLQSTHARSLTDAAGLREFLRSKFLWHPHRLAGIDLPNSPHRQPAVKAASSRGKNELSPKVGDDQGQAATG